MYRLSNGAVLENDGCAVLFFGSLVSDNLQPSPDVAAGLGWRENVKTYVWCGRKVCSFTQLWHRRPRVDPVPVWYARGGDQCWLLLRITSSRAVNE